MFITILSVLIAIFIIAIVLRLTLKTAIVERYLWNGGKCYRCATDYTFIKAGHIGNKRHELYRCKACGVTVVLKKLIDELDQTVYENKTAEEELQLLKEIEGDKSHTMTNTSVIVGEGQLPKNVDGNTTAEADSVAELPKS